MTGSQVEGTDIYWWGSGISLFSQNAPLIYKVSANGSSIWNTIADSAFAGGGIIYSCFVEPDGIYSLGQKSDGKNFLVKLDKQTGKVIYRKDDTPISGGGIIRHEMKGTDTMRLYLSDEIWGPRIYSSNFSLKDGTFSTATEPLSTGLNEPGQSIPLYFDEEAAYYKQGADYTTLYITKKDRATNQEQWTKEIYREKHNMYKAGGYDYFFGGNVLSCLRDSDGSQVWASRFVYGSFDSYDYNACAILGDTLYVVWAPLYDANELRFSVMTKWNKNTGELYWMRNITNEQDAAAGYGYLQKPTLQVSEKGDIYLLGRMYSNDQKHLKKLSGFDGQQVYDLPFPKDTFPEFQYKVPAGNSSDIVSDLVWANGKLNFLIVNAATDNHSSTGNVNFITLEDPEIGIYKKQNFNDRPTYQFPSTAIDLQVHGNHYYILKSEAAEVFLEKYEIPQQLVWRKRLTAPGLYYLNPGAFAIDSAEHICILASAYASPVPYIHTLSAYDYVNTSLILDSSGTVLKRDDSYEIKSDEPWMLAGDTGDSFYSFSKRYYNLVNVIGYYEYYYENRNQYPDKYFFLRGQNVFNKSKNVILTQDSIFTYSNPQGWYDKGFVLGISKHTGKSSSKVQLPTNQFINGVVRSGFSDALYTYGSHYIGDYIGFPAICKLTSPMGAAIWTFSLDDQSGVFTGFIEKADSNIIAVAMKGDSMIAVQLNGGTGSLMWRSAYVLPSDVTAYDLAVNDENNMAIIPLATVTDNGKNQQTSYLQMNAASGEIIRKVDLPGKAGTINNMLFVKNIPVLGIVMGGNLTNDTLGGYTGYTLLNTDTAPLPCKVSVGFSYSIADKEVNFNNQSEAAVINYKWDFGDGSTESSARSPVHTFPEAKDYFVCLTGTNANGCEKTVCDSVSILNMARVTASPNPATTMLYLDFNSETATPLDITVMNMNGDLKLRITASAVAGKNYIGIPVATIPPGMYFVVMNGKGMTRKINFVKL